MFLMLLDDILTQFKDLFEHHNNLFANRLGLEG